ncbi:hypothetical protein RQM65_05030 [Pricia sp. S334]|uniref:DUF2231 domain-containing protein n=1 Tax=Pricia mediterranea TaxID=3076079 RepID=A0ABU3L2P9_9FLAO|nr:hypothetical protein [Pricia sp. S334]MDT7828026.1 hypothetical protein [Pricia sp. S334]
MEEIPSIWRTEVWHALSIHLPIVLLSLASIAYCSGLFVTKNGWPQFIARFTFLALVLGVLSAWVSIYLGEEAYNVVVRTLCDPNVLQEHQWWAYFSVYVYSAATLLFMLFQYDVIARSRPLSIFLAVLLLTGFGGLVYSGHMGASVVYQQAGGTYVPSENCVEFE